DLCRDRARATPTRPGMVGTPADGVVQMVQPALPPAELGLPARPLVRISVFMNVFDVHVNRSPCGGIVTGLAYRPGAFFNASRDKASDLNQRQSIRLRRADGRELVIVQIAGLVARRIRCAVSASQTLRAGQRIGIIRFGSRVDLYLPDAVAPLVAVGQRMVAGESGGAALTSAGAARRGAP